MFFVKLFVSAAVIALAAELAKRFTFWSVLLLALPLSSLLALSWTYWETADIAKTSAMSWGVFWLVPPSLVFFPVFSLCLEKSLGFVLSMFLGCLAALITYLLYAKVLHYFGVQL